MSDSGGVVRRWEAPWFEQAPAAEERPSLEQSQALAQLRGFQLGKDEGLAAGRAEVESTVASLRALAEHLAAPFRDLDAVVSRELAQLAMLLARRIVQRELALDSAVIEDIVSQALATLYRLEGEVAIFVNPADAGRMAEFSPESLEGKSWKIVEDASLSPGGCQVKTPTSFVDASVEKRMETIFEQVLHALEDRD